jgi:hypothetical protein
MKNILCWFRKKETLYQKVQREAKQHRKERLREERDRLLEQLACPARRGGVVSPIVARWARRQGFTIRKEFKSGQWRVSL